MSSTFGGIQQAASSLAASQYGLQIVEQNISNASTPGYTRQSADLGAVDSVGGVPRRYVTGGGAGGVQVISTSRLNDPVIDARARTEHARSATTDTAASQLSQIEDVFPEPSDSGLGGQLSTFWSDWASVANTPNSDAARGVLLQDGNTVANTLQAMSQSLSDVQNSTATSLQGDLGKANSAASSLATLNKQIALGTATGSNVNSLLDQRDQLLDQLSSLVGGVATINADGTASVTVGGQYLVNAAPNPTGAPGTQYSVAQLSAVVSNSPGTSGTPYDPTLDKINLTYPTYDATGTPIVDGGGNPVTASGAITLGGGSAAASFTTLTDTLPDVQSQLDAVATNLATTVNAIQAGGYDETGAAGTNIFSVPSSTGPGSVAAGISLTSITASGIAAATTQTAGGNNDGSNALAASKSGANTDPSTSADAAYASLVGYVGSKSSLAQQQQTTQDAVTASVDALRQSASGVSLDEEVTNMLTLQQAYQASSKVLATMNSMLDTLINGTGIGS